MTADAQVRELLTMGYQQDIQALTAERDRYRVALERCLAGIENFHATGTRQPTWDFRELSRAREVARAALEGEA